MNRAAETDCDWRLHGGGSEGRHPINAGAVDWFRRGTEPNEQGRLAIMPGGPALGALLPRVVRFYIIPK